MIVATIVATDNRDRVLGVGVAKTTGRAIKQAVASAAKEATQKARCGLAEGETADTATETLFAFGDTAAEAGAEALAMDRKARRGGGR
jgi:hypothetical protein